jgi:hypothetical protein
MRQREAQPGAGLALGIVALLTAGIVALVLCGKFVEDVTIPRGVLAMAEPTQPIRPVDGATPVTKLSAAALDPKPIEAAAAPAASAPADASAPSDTAAQPAAPASSATSALTVGGKARVVNTDGQGVVLYGAPRQSARQPAGLLEGTTVTVLELADSEWARVQSGSRQSGWVHAEFLARAD